MIAYFCRHKFFFCEKGKFVTNVYQKKTFSGVYTNFNILIPETYKTDLIKSLLFPCINLCLDFVKFHHKINKLKTILYKSSYPHDLVDKSIKEVSERELIPKMVIAIVPKKDLMMVLPYLGKLLLQICTTISCSIKIKLPCCNLWIVLQNKCKLSNCF